MTEKLSGVEMVDIDAVGDGVIDYVKNNGALRGTSELLLRMGPESGIVDGESPLISLSYIDRTDYKRTNTCANMVSTKSVCHQFGSCLVARYLFPTKTSHNFRFLKDPVSTPVHLPTLSDGMPREGESRPGDADKAGGTPDTADRIESRTERICVSKRKRADEDEGTHLPRKSSRPRVVKDYRALNDPMPELSDEEDDNLPGLDRDPDEEELEQHPVEEAELVYAALNESGALPDNPKTLKEARDSPEWPEWEKAVKAEIDQLHRMGTWELTDLPKGRVPVSNKWVLVQKYSKEGRLE